MSGRKKKLSAKLKRYNIMLIAALIVLMLLLGIAMIFRMLGGGDVYKIESRKENMERSKQNDGHDFETIGWVRVQGTNVDYPLYGLINQGYDYPVTESFLWSLNMDSLFHDTLIVYGHNVMNLGPHPIAHDESFTRLEELMNYVYYDFAQNNQYIQLSFGDDEYLYKIFAVDFIPVLDYGGYAGADEWTQEEKDEYVKRMIDESIYDYDYDYRSDDKILSVATCSRFFEDGQNYDFILTGRMVRPDEKVQLSRVKRNENYVEIDNKLKEGAEDDESVNEA